MNLFGFKIDDTTPGPEVQIGCAANVYIRQMHFLEAGHVERAHDHPFDHFTHLAYGSLGVSVDGRERIVKAPALILIRMRRLHTLVALQDGTVACCIHALRIGDSVEDILPFDDVPLDENPLSGTALLENPRLPVGVPQKMRDL